MSKYINLENLVADIDAAEQRQGMGHIAASTLRRYIKRQPLAAVVQARHGYWRGLEYDGFADGFPVYDLWECSECGEEVSGDDVPNTHLWCYNCGAKMDGEAK